METDAQKPSKFGHSPKQMGELQQAAEQLTLAMQEDPRFVGVNSDQDKLAPTVRVRIDRERAAALGVTPDDIQSTMGLAFGGQQVSQIYATTDQYHFVLELLPQYQLDYTGLSRLYLKGTGGAMVPLTAVTTVSRRTMPPTINHSGQIPAITVSFDMAPGKALSDAVTGVREATDRLGGLPTSVCPAVLPAPRQHSRAQPPTWACCY